MTIWLIILLIGIATFGMRLSFITALGQRNLPPQAHRALKLVPPAVLSAMILPELLYRDSMLQVSFANGRVIAGLIAALVAWRTRNILLTIGAGMAALMVQQIVF